jgi:hypothetical protein
MKKKKIRNWNAVNAHFRRSGPMKDKKKEEDKNHCRDRQRKDEE